MIRFQTLQLLQTEVTPSGVVVREAVVPTSLDVDGHQVPAGELQVSEHPT